MNRNERRRAAKAERRPESPLTKDVAAEEPARRLAEALGLHRAGRLAEAEALYRRVHRMAPRNPEALHFLGLIAHQRGDHLRAIELIERAIAIDGTIAAYHGNLGEAYRAHGRSEEAIGCYRRALALDAAAPGVHYCLGAALLDREAFDEAARELRAAVAADPDDAEAHLNLGAALVGLERLDEAIGSYRRALALRPDYPEALFNRGLALKAKGESSAAFDSLVRAAELAPDMAEAHYQIGLLYAARERYEQAIDAFRRALGLRPDMTDALLELGSALRCLHRGKEAIACYERVLALVPDSMAALNGIGHVHLEEGRFDEARGWFTTALERDPNSADACFSLGLAYQLQGRFEEAVAWHRRAVALDPRHGPAHYNLVKSRTFESRDEQVQAIEQVLALDSLDAAERSALYFALAKTHDDRGDGDAAFHCYKAGNEARKGTLPFEPDAFTAYVDRVISVFTPALFAEKRAMGLDSELPTFIVGMPRSGTSLVEQIVASHPDVHGAGELDYVRQIAHQLPERLGVPEPFPDCTRALDATTAQALAAEHLARLRERSATALRITDKMPNNFQRLGLIALLFPKARVIHCVRDPLDTCLSCYFQEFAHGQPFAYDLEHLGRYYCDYRRLMAHWHATLPGWILDVPYEALVADQRGWSEKLIAFLGLPWDDRCLAFHQTERLVRTASFWQVRQPIYASSVGRWRRYARHLGPLFESLGIEPPAEDYA